MAEHYKKRELKENICVYCNNTYLTRCNTAKYCCVECRDCDINDKKYKASPGLKTTDIASSGVHCFIPLSPAKESSTFSFQLNLNGSEEIQFVP